MGKYNRKAVQEVYKTIATMLCVYKPCCQVQFINPVTSHSAYISPFDLMEVQNLIEDYLKESEGDT